jgi:hypothetical protein
MRAQITPPLFVSPTAAVAFGANPGVSRSLLKRRPFVRVVVSDSEDPEALVDALQHTTAEVCRSAASGGQLLVYPICVN